MKTLLFSDTILFAYLDSREHEMWLVVSPQGPVREERLLIPAAFCDRLVRGKLPFVTPP